MSSRNYFGDGPDQAPLNANLGHAARWNLEQLAIVLQQFGALGSTNTTVDSNGFVKKASPTIQLYHDKIERSAHERLGYVEFERLGIGHYILRNAPLLARSGWYIETPKDRNNNIYFTMDYEEIDGDLIINTYEPDYSSGRVCNGEPVDILIGRYISLRFAENAGLYVEEGSTS